MNKFVVMSAMFALIGCASTSMTPPAQSGGMPKDGELAFPSDYKSFPTFLKGIQKPDAVRDLYINPTGGEGTTGTSLRQWKYVGDGNLQRQEKCRRKFRKRCRWKFSESRFGQDLRHAQRSGMGEKRPGKSAKRRLGLLSV